MGLGKCFAVAAALVTGASSAGAAILSETFEGYADTAAMQGVWGAAGAGTLDTADGNPGKSMFHPAGVSNQVSFAATQATDAQPLIWEFDFLDDGLGNKRITGALRDVGGSAAGNQAFFEMGRFNSIDHPDDSETALVSGYGIRAAFVGGPAAASNWITFGNNPTVETGWHHFKATIGATTATFELDLDGDGTIDGSRTFAINGAAKRYNFVRFGGPSDVSSAGGGGNFDNLSVDVAVPEPGSLAFVGVAGAGLLLRRRRLA